MYWIAAVIEPAVITENIAASENLSYKLNISSWFSDETHYPKNIS